MFRRRQLVGNKHGRLQMGATSCGRRRVDGALAAGREQFQFAGAPLREELRAYISLHNNIMPHSIPYVSKRCFCCPTSQYQCALLHIDDSCESSRGAFGAEG